MNCFYGQKPALRLVFERFFFWHVRHLYSWHVAKEMCYNT